MQRRPYPIFPVHLRTAAAVLIVCLATPSLRPAFGQGTAQRVTVTRITVEGNSANTDRGLILTSSGLAEGRSYTITEFTDVTARAVRQLWNLNLFSDVQILSGEQNALPGGTVEIDLIIKVVERPVLNVVTFQGNDKLSRKKLLEASRLREGGPIGPSVVGGAVERLKQKYREEGYLRAEVSSELLPATGDSSSVNLIVSVTEGPKVGISDIVILGNEALTDRQVRKAMKTGTGFLFFSRGKYDRQQIADDRTLIADRYAESGYWDAHVVSDSLGYDPKGKDITLYITVEEGEIYTMGTSSWEGIDRFGQEKVDELVTIHEGEPLDRSRVDQTRLAVQDLYLEQGYVYCRVEPQPEFAGADGHTVNFTWVVQEGQPASVAHIFITGNTKTKDHVIRRELLLKPGDTFSSSRFNRSLREVMALNFFANVELDPPPTPTANGDLDVTIKVTEKPTGQATMGAGYSERDGLIGNLGLSLPNLFGNGQQLNFTWDFGSIRRTIQFGFTEPWFLNTPTLIGFNVYRSELFWTTFYKHKRHGATFQIGRRLRWPDDYFRTSVGYRIEDTSFTDFSSNYNPSPAYDLRRYDWPIRNSSVSWTVTRDSRDRPEFPTMGSINSLRTEIAGGPFGGDEQYVKWDLSQSFFFPSWWNFALNMRVRAGLVEGFTGWGKSGFVPYNAKYLPGGTSFDGQIRGYDNRRVGPIDTDGLEVGGQSMLIFTMEYTFPVAPQQSLYGLLFADAGNAWLDLGDTDPFNLRRSVGFGVRMFTPLVGLIGFDFAYGFDHFVNGRRHGRWIPHFQFGTQFY